MITWPILVMTGKFSWLLPLITRWVMVNHLILTAYIIWDLKTNMRQL